MKDVKSLINSIQGLSSDEQAKIISNYCANRMHKKTVEDARKEIRAKCFVGCKALTKVQQISYLYEFVNANSEYISRWMTKNYPNLADDNK